MVTPGAYQWGQEFWALWPHF